MKNRYEQRRRLGRKVRTFLRLGGILAGAYAALAVHCRFKEFAQAQAGIQRP